MKDNNDKIEAILKNDKTRNYGLIVFCVVSLIIFILFYFFGRPLINKVLFKNNNQTSQADNGLIKKKNDVCENCVRRRLDGVMVEKGKENMMPFAVMIENHLDARPQSGLAGANLVYEAEAEGGITRFLAVFDGLAEVEKIGPIRSARSYYLDWAQDLGALYIHCGGSPEALARIINEDVFDLNEFYKGKYFYRDSDRPAPHNIYTASNNIKEYMEASKNPVKSYSPWLFKDENIPAGETISSTTLTIKYLSPEFMVEWKYDKEKNEYRRFMGGAAHNNESGAEIRVKNIIIQSVKAEVIDDDKRLKVETVGTGKSVICLDGLCQKGRWEKRDKSERTKYYYENGEEAVFNAGKIWVEIVQTGYEVSY